jgi:hypothetical protein
MVDHDKHLLRAIFDTAASISSIILEAYTSDLFIKTDHNNTTTWNKMGGKFTTTKPGLVIFSLPEFNLKKQVCSSWTFHADDCSESSSTFDMIIGNKLRSSWRIRYNHELQWLDGYLRCWHYSNKRQRYSTPTSIEALIEFYMSTNEPQMLRDEYSQTTKILDAEYKPASLDDVIRMCESPHVEEQHQLKILLQKYEHLFDGRIREINIEKTSISLQLTDPNFKLFMRVHTLILDQ